MLHCADCCALHASTPPRCTNRCRTARSETWPLRASVAAHSRFPAHAEPGLAAPAPFPGTLAPESCRWSATRLACCASTTPDTPDSGTSAGTAAPCAASVVATCQTDRMQLDRDRCRCIGAKKATPRYSRQTSGPAAQRNLVAPLATLASSAALCNPTN